MSQFDAFSPFGVLSFSSETSPCEKIYDSLGESMGPAFQGPIEGARTYARAMCLGVSQLQIEAAGAQDDPAQCSYLLPALEKDYRVVPPSGATEADRRVALGIAADASQGGAQDVIIAGLTALLGDGFVHARPSYDNDAEEIENSPATPDLLPVASAPIRRLTIAETIWPGAQTVNYTIDYGDGNVLKAGDVVRVAHGKPNLAESVTVTHATATTFTATFAKTHEAGEVGLTGPYSDWTSNRRSWLVVVTADTLADYDAVTKINEYMSKTLPTVSTWCICTESDPVAHEVGGFSVGSPVGAPIGAYGPDAEADAHLETDPTGTYL